MKDLSKKIAIYFFVALFGLLAFFPAYWMIKTSLEPEKEIYKLPPKILPRNLALDNYINLVGFVGGPFKEGRVFLFIWNSFVYGAAQALLVTLVCSLGAYSLTRFRYWGPRRWDIGSFFGRFIIFFRTFPVMLLTIPLYLFLGFDLGLRNTYLAPVLVQSAMQIPFFLWMLYGYFAAIPMDYEESALVDGASRLRVLFSILMPIVSPGVLTVAALSFVNGWNNWFWVMIFNDVPETYSLGYAIMMVMRMYIGSPSHGLLMALCTIIALPPMVTFIIGRKYIIEGLVTGTIKR